MKLLQLGIVTAITMIASLLPATAQQSLTITGNAPIYSGPGLQHVITGTLPANSPVVLDHCENSFCLVYYGRVSAWIEQQYVGGPAPQPQPLPQPQPQPQPQPNPGWPWPNNPWPQPQPPRPQPQPPVFDDAGACFYSERNFRGSSFCVDEGDSYSRLRTWDNKIRSIEVFGGARVDLCSEANYRGNCVTLRSDATRLPAQLDRKTSSIDVY